MAVRKDSKKIQRRSTEPFNNPFHDNLRKLKRGVRNAREAAAAVAPAVAEASGNAANADAVVSDDDRFLAAVEGAEPLGEGGRRIGVSRHGDCAQMTERLRTGVDDPTADENFDVRFSDRFIRGRASGVSRETLSKLEQGEFAVRSHVDLHGMPLDDARTAVDEFIVRCQKRGERCVLVITGKGRNSRDQVGVLREGIPEWLARGPSSRRVLAFVTSRPCDGGEGALYVLLRKGASRKNRIDVESGGGV